MKVIKKGENPVESNIPAVGRGDEIVSGSHGKGLKHKSGERRKTEKLL